MVSKLYPTRCPFCGHQPHHHLRCAIRVVHHRSSRHVSHEHVYRVSCSHCHARGPRRKTERLAVRAWNKRPGVITLEAKKAFDDERDAEDNYERNWRD